MNDTEHYPADRVLYGIDPLIGRLLINYPLNFVDLVGYILLLWVLYTDKSFSDPSFRFHKTIAWTDLMGIVVYFLNLFFKADYLNTPFRHCMHWHLFRFIATCISKWTT